jgi:sugar phosphate isomerase/epimerase
MYQTSIDITPFGDFWNGLQAAVSLGISNIETGNGFDSIPYWELNGNQTEEIRNLLIDYGRRIVLATFNAPIEKLDAYQAAFRRAHLLNVEQVKISPPGGIQAGQEGTLIEIARMGKAYGIRVLFENENASLLCDDRSMTQFYNQLAEQEIGFIYNPLEFVAGQHHPFFHMFYNSKLKNEIVFLRLCDGLYSTKEPAPLCRGNAEIKELISILLSRTYHGYFSLCPYLPGDPMAVYTDTYQEFKEILKTL